MDWSAFDPLRSIQQNTRNWLQKQQQSYQPETITPAKPEHSQPQPAQPAQAPAQSAERDAQGQNNVESQKQVQEATKKQNYQPITSNFAGVGAYIGSNAGRIGETLNKYYQGTQDAGQSAGESRLSGALAQQGAIRYSKETEKGVQADADKLKANFTSPEALKAFSDEMIDGGYTRQQAEDTAKHRAAENQASIARLEREARVNEMLRTGNVDALAGEAQKNSVWSKDYQAEQDAIVNEAAGGLVSNLVNDVTSRRDAAAAAEENARKSLAETAQNPEVAKKVNNARALLGLPSINDGAPISITQGDVGQYDKQINEKIAATEKDLKQAEKMFKVGDRFVKASQGRRIKEMKEYVAALKAAQQELLGYGSALGGAQRADTAAVAEAARLRSAYERLNG